MDKYFRWKSLLINFAIIWLFAYGFKIFAYLNNPEIAKTVRGGDFENAKYKLGASEIGWYVVFTLYAYIIGYVVAFLSCFVFSQRKKIDFFEGLIALVVFIIISLFGFTGWDYLKFIFLTPGEVSGGIGYFVINGLSMISIGICLIIIKRKLYLNKNSPQPT